MTIEKCIQILDNWVERNEKKEIKEIDYPELVALYHLMKIIYFMLKEK